MAKKEQQEWNPDIEDYVSKAKALRAEMAMATSLREKDVSEKREDFRKFFIKLQNELKLDKSLESIVWKHLVAIDCAKSDKFEEGIVNFGLRK